MTLKYYQQIPHMQEEYGLLKNNLFNFWGDLKKQAQRIGIADYLHFNDEKDVGSLVGHKILAHSSPCKLVSSDMGMAISFYAERFPVGTAEPIYELLADLSLDRNGLIYLGRDNKAPYISDLGNTDLACQITSKIVEGFINSEFYSGRNDITIA